MKIIYTESALVELDRFQNQRKEELESLLKTRKYVFGDDVLEIQLALVISGLGLSLASFLGSYYFRVRVNRRAELERIYVEFESRKKPDSNPDN